MAENDENNRGTGGGGGTGDTSAGQDGSGAGGEEPLQSSASVEDQARAKEMGWIPPTEWRGSKDKWTDAGEFLKRGETFVPFLQAERKRLNAALAARDQESQQLREELRQTRESVQELATFSRDMAKERNARRKAELNGLIKQATDSGDESGAAELRAELTEIVGKERTADSRRTSEEGNGEGRPAERRSSPPPMQPWVKTWLDIPENGEFVKDIHRADVFNGILARKRAAGDKRVGAQEGTELLNEVIEEARQVFGTRSNPRRQEDSRTEETRTSGGSGTRSNGKSYNDLPREAKEKCDAQESRYTGPKKLFKDQAAWRKHYASEYFGPSAAVADRMMTRGE